MKWIETLRPGEVHNVVLLQIDLVGHSAWFDSSSPLYVACRERTRLANHLRESLAYLGYERMFWAGDGGVFVSRPDGRVELVCEAADTVFNVFEDWRKDREIEIRVTATFARIDMGPDPGLWCSRELNEFLKYERELGHPGAFVITHVLREELRPPDDYKRFQRLRRVALPNGQSVDTYVDTKHPIVIRPSERTFGAWLRHSTATGALPGASMDGDFVRIGRCTVLDTAYEVGGYREIEMEEEDKAPEGAGIDRSDYEEWQRVRDELRRRGVSGTSAQVMRFSTQVTDDRARLRFRPIDYVDARAFLAIEEKEQGIAERYRVRALQAVTTDGTSIPNILSTGVIVIVGDAAGAPQIIVTKRRGRTGGFDEGTWAVSIAEQFMPIFGLRGGHSLAADRTIYNSAQRGLREELLGDGYRGRIQLSIHAFVEIVNNYFFLAIADLRPLSFVELTNLWREAPDYGEHERLIALPLTRDALSECLTSSGFPVSSWKVVCKENLIFPLHDLSDDNSPWQPNSHVRLAAAVWYLESLLK